MKVSFLLNLFESAGIITLAGILFAQLQFFGKVLVIVWLAYWIVKYYYHVFWGIKILSIMLIKAFYRIFEYHIAWLLKL